MKRLLMLGGSPLQMPAIKKAREMGHYVITCDHLENNPGHKYAHEYYNVSTTDREDVLELAKSLAIDGVVCYVADSGAPTAAYVAEKLGLPSHPLTSVEILVNKDEFRKFQKKNGFNIPQAKGYQSYEEAVADFYHYKMPVMIKPVDSSGSKGISKIESIDLLKEKVKYALDHSRAKRFIVEEYIKNYGPHVGGDGFSVNGELVFRCFSNEYFSTDRVNPFVSVIATWPSIMPGYIQHKIHDEIQRALDLLGMKTGAFNFDIRIGAEEKVYLIEIAPRNGGEWNPHAISYATGIDLIEYTIKAALGEDCRDLRMKEPEGYWVAYVLNSKNDGRFKGIELHEDIKNNIVEYELVVQMDETISALSGSHEKVGVMILKFMSMDEMSRKMKKIDYLVNVKVEAQRREDISN